MRYGSVCSGIEAATVAWHPLGWTPVFFSENGKFQSAVLAHRHRDVLNLGDMTRHREWQHGPIDLLVGGTPCQSFSVAGLRKGLDDPRGNLALVFLAIADRTRPRWLVWENVPGVLSSNGGRDFGSFLGGLGQLGYGWAYRVLDAQYFGVAQQRERVFVIGYLGDWRRSAAVLFERGSLSRNPKPSAESASLIARSVALRGRDDGGVAELGGHVAAAIRASKGGGDKPHVLVDGRVRRMTPREVERAFEFPDDYTLVPYRGKPAADGPRYYALGNSMPVPVMRWIGRRIASISAAPFNEFS